MSISEKFSGAIGRTVNDKKEIKDDLKLKEFRSNNEIQTSNLNQTKNEYSREQTQSEYNPRNRNMKIKESINHENMKISSAHPVHYQRLPESFSDDNKICLDLFMYFNGTLNKLIKNKEITSTIDLEHEKDFFMKTYAKKNVNLSGNVLNKLRENIQIVIECTKIHSYTSTCPAHVQFTSDYFTPTRMFDNYRCAYPIMANQKMNHDCYEVNSYQTKTWNMIEKQAQIFRNYNDEIMTQMGSDIIENPDEQGGRFYKTLDRSHPIVEIHSTDGIISKEHQQYLKQHKNGKYIVSDEALEVLKQTTKQKFDKLPIIKGDLKYSIKPFGDDDRDTKERINEYLYAIKDVVKDSTKEKSVDGIDNEELQDNLSKHFEIIVKMTIKFKFQVPDPNLINIKTQ